jgi:hypothetical protein
MTAASFENYTKYINKLSGQNAEFCYVKQVVHIATVVLQTLSKGCHLDVVRGPSTPHDPESDAGGSLSSWQDHPSR